VVGEASTHGDVPTSDVRRWAVAVACAVRHTAWRCWVGVRRLRHHKAGDFQMRMAPSLETETINSASPGLNLTRLMFPLWPTPQ